jgi:DNA-binding GntR family transcriptional regulator
MPVIEALRRLERDGLVVHVPHLGSFVRESTVEDLRELYCIRRGLECEACRLFVQRASADEKRQLVEINNQINTAGVDENLQEYLKLDMQFHMHIVNGARMPRLKEMIENRHLEERIFQNAPELKTCESIQYLVGLHDAIVEAIGRGDEEAAAEALRKHLVEAERQYLESVGDDKSNQSFGV